LRSPKSHDNRGETLDHSIENFRRLENIFKAYTAKESGRRHLDSTTTIKSKEGRLKDSEK